MRAPRREDDSRYEPAEWATQWRQKQGYRHQLRVMLDHDEIRVDKHVERYTRSRVAKMWKSYRASGMAAMDEKGKRESAVEGAPSMDDLFPGAR